MGNTGIGNKTDSMTLVKWIQSVCTMEKSVRTKSGGNADQEENKCIGPVNRRIQVVCRSSIC